MQYLTEINIFEYQMKSAPLSGTAQLMWYKLMHLCNALHWPEWVIIDNERLAQMACIGVNSKRALFKARQELIDGGYIEFKSGTKAHPSRYKLCSLAEKRKLEEAQAAAGQPRTPPDAPGQKKPEKGDGEEKTGLEKYLGYTEEIGASVTQFTAELWNQYLPGKRPSKADERMVFEYIHERSGEGEQTILTLNRGKKELLELAIERTVLAGKQDCFWPYIAGIHRNWSRKGITTFEQVLENEERWDQRERRNTQ